MELDITTIVIIAVIAVGISLAILYYIIFNAVKNAIKDGDYYGRAQTRLLIKKMLKEGISKQEIVSTIDDYEIDFWNKINEKI